MISKGDNNNNPMPEKIISKNILLMGSERIYHELIGQFLYPAKNVGSEKWEEIKDIVERRMHTGYPTAYWWCQRHTPNNQSLSTF